MEEKQSPEREWDSLSDVDLYTAEMFRTSTSETTSGCTGSLLCSACPKRALKSCLTCMASYCENHVAMHLTAPALQRHRLVEATEDLEQRLCQQHYRELEFYCNTDQTPVCAKCITKQHRGHDIAELDENEVSHMMESCLAQKRGGTLPSAITCSPFENLHTSSREISTLKEQCQEISKSPPQYLLPTEKSYISQAIRKFTFGKSDYSKSTKTILLLGETGAGKTTLINTMVNYMLGVKREDYIWFQITEEEKTSNQAECQTSAITVYELFLETSSSCLKIIDTPGYGATDEKKFDVQFSDNLHTLFQSEDDIHKIEVVGLVVKASQNRLTAYQRHIYSAILSLFDNGTENQLMVFVTHSDGMAAPNIITALNEAKVPCVKDCSGEPLLFMFNNRQHEKYEGNEENLYHTFWNLGSKSLQKFFRILEGIDKTKVKLKQDVSRKRTWLIAHIINLQLPISMAGLKQNMLQQVKSAWEENRDEFEVDEPYKSQVEFEAPWWHLNKGAMCCTHCEENCHYPNCWWVKGPSWCSIMKNNRCTVCTKKCPASAHVKQSLIYDTETERVRKMAADFKEQYKRKENIEKELRNAHAKQVRLLEEAYQSILELNQKIFRKFAFSDIDLEFFIDKMEEMGHDVKVQKLRSIQSASRDVRRQERSSGTEENEPLLRMTEDNGAQGQPDSTGTPLRYRPTRHHEEC